jgi:Tfp pilus assembly protein PilN
MLNINFVPDDYIQNNESQRTNLIYLALFAVVMTALGGVFLTIKIRQRTWDVREDVANTKIAQAQEAIKQFEQLQTKRREMMKRAFTTTELLEPVPKSILLASLTNSLPAGVSLLRLKLIQKEATVNRPPAATTKYQAAQNEATQNEKATTKEPQKKALETHIDIEGVAGSDRQVAAYIGRLSSSTLLENVELVESKECKIDGETFRQFKLAATLKGDVHLTKEAVKNIKPGV